MPGQGSPVFKFRLSEADRERWQATADREGLNLSEWVRGVCNVAAGVTVTSKPKLTISSRQVTPDPKPTGKKQGRKK